MSLAFDPVNWKEYYKGVKARTAGEPRKRLLYRSPIGPQLPKRLLLAAKLYARPIGPHRPAQDATATPVVRDILFISSVITPSEMIIIDVCKRFNVSRAEIKSHRRYEHIALARQVIMYRMRKEVSPPLSLPQIGRKLGGRDHTTVLHGIRKIEAMIKRGELTL